jgi:molybdopterin biosynthesis enzyme
VSTVILQPSISINRGVDLCITGSDDGQEFEIRILLEKVPVADNVRQPGSDARKGERVLEKGTVIGSGGGEVGLLGFVGKREVSQNAMSIVHLSKKPCDFRCWSTVARW